MKFGINFYADDKTHKYVTIFNKFESEISSFLKNRNYGRDIEEIMVRIYSYPTEFQFIFKSKPPKYYRDKRRIVDDEADYEVYKLLEYEITIPYETLICADENQVAELIEEALVDSISGLKKINKIKNFKWNDFEKDLRIFFSKEI